MVASSFGKLVMKENPWDGVREEDIALALLMMITNNIGQVAHLNAQLHSCSKIFFVGSFLRHNPISCRRLSFAIDFWSAGKMEAIFLAHEGYFGALGTFLESAFGDEVDRFLLDITIDADEAVKTDNNSNANQDINSEPEDGNHMSLVEKLSPLNAAMSYFDGFKQTVAGRQRSNSATNVTSGNTNENYSLPQLLDYLSVDSQKGSIKNSTNYSNSHFLRARSISDDSAIRSQKKNMNSFIANNENKSSGKSISSLSTSNSEVCNSYEDTNDDTIYEDSK